MWNNGASSALRTTLAPVFSSPSSVAAYFATSFAASATPPPITTAVTLSASFLAGDNISNPTLTGFPSAVSTYTMIFLHSAMSFVLPS